MNAIIEYWRGKINLVRNFGLVLYSNPWHKAKIYYWVNLGFLWFKKNEKELIIVLMVILTSTFSFGLGRLAKIKELREPITIQNAESVPAVNNLETQSPKEGIVASKKGTKYYLTRCYNNPIKPENVIAFKTEVAAQQAGYKLATTCQ